MAFAAARRRRTGRKRTVRILSERTVGTIVALVVCGGMALAGGCDVSGMFGASGSGQPSGGTSGASSGAKPGPTLAPRDDTPPSWTPMGYSEIPWVRAEELIRNRDVNRVIATQTRRAYIITGSGDEHFTIEPQSGALTTLLAGVPRGEFLVAHVDEIPWQDAETLLRERRASGIMEGHFRTVYVTVKGGGSFLAIPPESLNVSTLVKEADPSLDVTVE